MQNFSRQSMEQAFAEGQFHVVYQPIVDSVSLLPKGFEALLRWTTAEGSISPQVFIEAAEANGFIGTLGSFVLATATSQLAALSQAAGRSLYISVNVSPLQFIADGFPAEVEHAVKAAGIEFSQLMLEVTEGHLVMDQALVVSILSNLRQQGVRVAIDDFGVGHSSLLYLETLPVSVVKLDKSLVDEGQSGHAICRAIIKLSQLRGLDVVAEGVESEHQLRQLAASGCKLIQGYFTGKPMSYTQALALF